MFLGGLREGCGSEEKSESYEYFHGRQSPVEGLRAQPRGSARVLPVGFGVAPKRPFQRRGNH